MEQDNKNQTGGSKKEKRGLANRTLYLALALLLCLGAVIAGVAASVTGSRRAKSKLEEPPAMTTGTEQPKKEPEGNADLEPEDVGIPTLAAPTVGRIIKLHDLTIPVYSLTLDEYRAHEGIDIQSEQGADVVAMAAGIITKIEDRPLLGHSVSVLHSGDLVTVYSNLTEEEVSGIEEGRGVAAGQLIGHVGDSAISECCDEPHLHLEMTLAGSPVDPLDYISASCIAPADGADEGFED